MRTAAGCSVRAGLGGLGWAALLTLSAGLSGCNLVAGVLLAGDDAPAERSAGAGDPARLTAPAADDARELRIALRPGVSLLQAAERAPRAVSVLRGAARRLGNLSVLDGSYLQAVSGGLLDEGLLLPGPLGALEIRTITPEAPAGEATALAAPLPPAPQEKADCASARPLPEVVGAYRAGTQLLLLRADGQFLLTESRKSRGGHPASQLGRYFIRCQIVELQAVAAPAVRLTQIAHDGLIDDRGTAFFPLTEPKHGDAL